MQTKLQTNIETVLKQFPEYWEDEVLLKHRVIEDLRNYKEVLINALISDELINESYSIQVGDNRIFKIEDFVSMLRYKNYLENSYTKYSNEIGLTSEGKYFKYTSDVILDFPHKDGILVGAMTQEDIEKEEVYYHNVLAKEEIDVLFSPKVFTNVKKYDSNGEHEATGISKDDNLIIKGNNLLALHTLNERYTGKVKLIYIDPPYNTGNDSFKYNDRFNHSTWLTFMKNRLEIAKEILSEEGSIWINIDDDESHYLKVLADEIFGRNNFLANIIWQKKYSPQNDAKYFSDMHDHILVYAKNKDSWVPNPMPRSEAMDARYTNRDNDPRGSWKSADFTVRTYSSEYDYEIITPSGRRVRPANGRSWGTSKENFEKLVEDNRIWFGEKGSNVPSVKKFLSEVKNGMSPITTWSGDDLYENETIELFWHYSEVSHTQDAKKELIALSLDFSTPKPEKLIQRILNIGSNEGDLVLDFFMGSATTQAVAMKMNRQFIGVEQMDYINMISVPRLQKVIEGEQGGISKDLSWTGGGSFIYAEFFDLNQKYIHSILNTTNNKKIQDVLTSMKNSDYLNLKVDLEKLFNHQESFFELTLNEQKKLLIQVLDNNQLYLNYSEIDDTQYAIDDQVKAFNHSFYQEGV